MTYDRSYLWGGRNPIPRKYGWHGGCYNFLWLMAAAGGPKMRMCETCGVEIAPKRLEVLPHTKTCAKCSMVRPVLGFGRPGQVVVVAADDENAKHWATARFSGGGRAGIAPGTGAVVTRGN